MPVDGLGEMPPRDGRGLRALVDDADLVSLLPALAHATGDMALCPDDLRPDPGALIDPHAGWSSADLGRATDLAVGALRRWEEADRGPARGRDDRELRRLIEWVAGTDLDDDYATMLEEELGLTGDPRAPAWTRSDLAPGTTLRVAVIGAGMSGILAAHRLLQAGIDVVVLEKNPDVGGTWFENAYPGCRVDVFNHVYSYSFAQKPDWPLYHSSRDVLLEYFRGCARSWGVREHVRFGVTVESMAWNDHRSRWHLQLRTLDESARPSEELMVDAVVTAVGQLNQPLLPDIAGMERFAGAAFHSARWRHDVDFSGRRVAVVGTGASAMQFVPHLADAAEHVTVFQRTPAWLIPRPEYHAPLPVGLLRLFDRLPGYAHWFRLRLFWRTHEGSVGALRRDPDWDGPLERAVSPANDEMRALLTAYLEHELRDRPDLLEKVVPQYPVGAKRVILDNGIWPATLKRDDVRLVTEPISEMVEAGVCTTDGEVHRADVIVYGTGFQASRFLMPMSITGRGGVDLHEMWQDDARAHLGITVPGFPNLFCLYGPNTNIVVNGSIIFFSECEVRYVLDALRLLLATGSRSIECRRETFDAFVARVDQRNFEMAWGISGVNSWYKSPTGRVAQNWPFPLLDYWRQTREVDPADYLLG